MAEFEPGHKKVGGKTKGTKSSISKDVREALARISADYVLNDGVKGLKADLDAMRPVDRAATQEKYLKYWLPTMGTLSVSAQGEGDSVEISVVYVKADEAKPDDDDEDMDYSEKV